MNRQEMYAFEQKYKLPKRIYVFDTTDNTVKIGVSKDVENRVRALQFQSGKIIRNLYYTDFCSNSIAIETLIKKELSQYLLNGEWYNVSFEKAKEMVIQYYDKHHKLILRDKTDSQMIDEFIDRISKMK